MDHGEHAPHLLYDSLKDVLGPAILPPPPCQPKKDQGATSTSSTSSTSTSKSPTPGPGLEDAALLRRVGQEWTIPPEEIAKRCAFVCVVFLVISTKTHT